MEYNSKDLRDTSLNKAPLHTHLRTRLGFTAAPSPKTEIKIEIQDTRTMGSETPAAPANPTTSTVGNNKGIDLTQGYFAIEEGPVKLAVGRQKMQLGAGRFLSTLEWHPYSRAFDGASFNITFPLSTLTGLSYLVRDADSTKIKDRILLSGLYYSHQIMPDLLGEVYTFYDQSRLAVPASFSTSNHDLVYLGQRIIGKYQLFTFEEEFIYQAGEATANEMNVTSEAYQLALRAGVATDLVKFNLGLDIMSGDNNSTEDGNMSTYRASYFFAHQYYGWMDYFIINPTWGVIDYRADLDITLFPNELGNPRLTLKPQYHIYVPHKAPKDNEYMYGQEFNLEAHLGLYPKSNIVIGAGWFVPGKNAYKLTDAKLPEEKTKKQDGFFLYFMPVFNF